MKKVGNLIFRKTGSTRMSLRRINFQRLFYDNDCTTLYIKYGKSRFIKDVFAFNFSKRNVISSGAEEWPIQVNK